MIKDLKMIDRELKNNLFNRVQDSTNRAENSLFRALAMALMFSHHYYNEVKLELRLALISNLGDRRFNPYPALHQPHILKKYQSDPDLVLNYWQRQQQQCFINDNLILASATFNTPICLLTMDKEEYLNETYIVACRNPKENKVYIARVGKKFYCVFSAETNERIRVAREVIFEEIVNRVFQRSEEKERKEEDREVETVKEEKVHYPTKDQVVSLRQGRQHRKSLSDCNQLSQQLFVEQRKKQIEDISEPESNRPSLFHSEQLPVLATEPPLSPPQSFQPLELSESLQPSNILPSETSAYYDPSYDQMQPDSYQNYYSSYTYQHYMMPEQRYLNEPQQYLSNQSYAFPQPQPQGPVNNVRYTGRLKFFDQNGNYGFLVIDSLNQDLFVHYDDLSKAGLSRQKLFSLKNNYELRFQFTYYEYEGKQHKKSKKAVDLVLIPSE